jgi:predicted nucleotidyltransferase
MAAFSSIELGSRNDRCNKKTRIEEICRRHNVSLLELFGSATGSEFNPLTSDLDFLVEFGPFKKGGYAWHYFALLEDLKALSPYCEAALPSPRFVRNRIELVANRQRIFKFSG